MNPDYMGKLQALRTEFGRPISIRSGFRCPSYDKKKKGKGAHPTGKASDPGVSGPEAHLLIDLAYKHGFTGIGIKQHGMHKHRFIHLDTLTDEDHPPRPATWSYG